MNTNTYEFGPWKLTIKKYHILKSDGPEREKFEGELKLPQIPEMVFPDNIFCLEHTAGFGIKFTALDALKCVDPEKDTVKVAEAEEWRSSRLNFEFINKIVRPFDWTYTTDFRGNIFGDDKLKVINSNKKIDLEKLKVKEKILYYGEVILFEDELADHGVSLLSVKVRVMPKSFFILQRLFVRVDDVIVRINDTRLYHEADWTYILREYTSKEKKVNEMKNLQHLFTQPAEIADHLHVVTSNTEEIILPTNAVSE